MIYGSEPDLIGWFLDSCAKPRPEDAILDRDEIRERFVVRCENGYEICIAAVTKSSKSWGCLLHT